MSSSSTNLSNSPTNVPDVESSPSPPFPPDPEFTIPSSSPRTTLRTIHTYLLRRGINVVTFVIANEPVEYGPVPNEDKDRNFVEFINLRILQGMQEAVLNFGLHSLLRGRRQNSFVTGHGRGARIQRLYFTVKDVGRTTHYVAYDTEASDPLLYDGSS